MLPVSHRLRSSEDFRRVFRTGVKVRSDLGLIVSAPSPAHRPRLGVVVRGKVGSAVVRNTLKRRIRSLFAHYQEALGPVDVVVRCADTAGSMTFEEIREALESALGLREIRR